MPDQMRPTDLAALSESASRGPWKYPYRGFPGVIGAKHGCLWTSTPGRSGQINNEPDAEFIVALVNAYRAGELVHIADVAQ